MTLPPEPAPRGVPTRLALTLLAALALVGALAVASLRENVPGRTAVVVALPSAPGLREGADVTYLGIRVGTVRRIDLSTGRVVATVGVRRRDVVLRAGDTVRLRTLGLLGADRVLDITPGPRTARAVGAGDTLVVHEVPPEPPPLSDSLLRRLFDRRDSAPRPAPSPR